MKEIIINPNLSWQVEPSSGICYILNRDNSGLFLLQDLGKEIWDIIEKTSDFNNLCSIILDKYEVEESVLKRDVEQFVHKLEKNGLIFIGNTYKSENSNILCEKNNKSDPVLNIVDDITDFELASYESIFMKATENRTLVSLTIELLEKCNWKCKHCYIPQHTSEGFSTEKVFDILEQAHAMGTFEILLTGGEVFLRPDIFKIIRKARSLHMQVYLFSNASLLDEEKIIEMSKLNVALLSCTIFSMDSTIHDKISGIPGSLQKTLENLQIAKKYNIPVEVKTIVMCDNVASYKTVQEYCNNYNFAYIASSSIFSKKDGDNSPCKLRINNEQLKGIISDLDEIVNFKVIKIDKNHHACPSMQFSAGIDCNGDFFPCSTLRKVIGNVYKSSIYDLWNSSDMKKFQDLKIKDLTDCSKCDKLDFCIRCPGIADIEEGNYLSASSLACQIADARYTYLERR